MLQFTLHTAAAVVHIVCVAYGMGLTTNPKFKAHPPSTSIVRRHYTYTQDHAPGEYYYAPDITERESPFASPLAMHTFVAFFTFTSHLIQAVLLRSPPRQSTAKRRR